jgi:hypothetical protein
MQQMNLQLRDVIHVGHARRTSDLGSILLVFVELDIDVLGDLRKRPRCIAMPEEVLGVEVIRSLLRQSNDDAVELELEAVGNKGLIRPAMGDHGGQVDVSVQDEQYWSSELGLVSCIKQGIWALTWPLEV